MKKYFMWGGISVCIIVICFGFWAYLNPHAAIKLFFDLGGLKKGQAIPAVSGETVQNGNVSLSKYHGERYVVMIGKADCEVCKKSYPTLAKLKNERHLQFIMLGQGKKADYARIKNKYDFKFPIMLADNNIRKKMNFKTFPVFYLVNRKGVITQRLDGFDKEKLQDLLTTGE